MDHIGYWSERTWDLDTNRDSPLNYLFHLLVSYIEFHVHVDFQLLASRSLVSAVTGFYAFESLEV